MSIRNSFGSQRRLNYSIINHLKLPGINIRTSGVYNYSSIKVQVHFCENLLDETMIHKA